MRLETTRLFLLPLSHDQLVKYIRCDNSLENELELQNFKRTISPALKEALEETILPNVADPAKNYLYNTLWTAITKAENTMVGDLCIVGEPNDAGQIEIGYGTYDHFQKNGYMTEAVGGIIAWARQQSAVSSIIASTEKSNIASGKVLEKNGFLPSGETDTMLQWTLPVKDSK